MITNLSILGSTGSIGTQTLQVIEAHKRYFKAQALSSGSNIDLLQKQVKRYLPRVVSVKSEYLALDLKKRLGKRSPEILWGEKGNIEVACFSKTDKVVVATPGLPGFKPTMQAIKSNKTIALATKEVLVAAGEVITKEAKKRKVSILPIDSEHSAIFQCLEGRSTTEVSRIFITCSGGPFRGMKTKDLKNVTANQALNHPNWKMGKKITIDSATLMNKGFEVIEAHWLFGIPFEKIKVIVHPQSIIHSAVEFVDGTIIAQIGPADMRLPIQYALYYPEKRKPNLFKRFSFDHYPNMTFEHPDTQTFRCLKLAYEAGKTGGTMPTVLNAANDVAVEAFLNGQLPFYLIPKVVEETMLNHKPTQNPSLGQILEFDSQTRKYASELIKIL